MRFLIFTLFLSLGFFCLSGCSTNVNRPFTEEQILQIYVATEFSSADEAQKVTQEYDLQNDTKRHSYYKVVRDMTDTPEKYEAFLSKVESYKQNEAAKSPAA